MHTLSRALLAFVAVGACCAAGVVSAEEFSWELAAFGSDAERDPSLDLDRESVQATRNFDGVDDASGPYALAAFLDPATRVSASLSRETFTARAFAAGSFTLPEMVTTTDEYSVAGRYLLRPSRWYFGGSYTEGNIDNPPLSQTFDSDSSGYGIVVGKYLGPMTTLEATFDASESRSESTYTLCVVDPPSPELCLTAGTLSSEQRRRRASVSVLHVRRFRSLTYALSARVAASAGDVTLHFPTATVPIPAPTSSFGPVLTLSASTYETSIPRLENYSIGAQLFPTAKIGVRVSYARWHDDTPADRAYEVGATWFVTRNVGLELALSRQEIDEGSFGTITDADFTNTDATVVRVIGRF